MYQDFRIISIDTSYAQKTIYITTSFDIDATSVDSSNIQVYDRVTKQEVGLTCKVQETQLVIELAEWPTPEIDYIVAISEIKSVIDDDLIAIDKNKVSFKNAIANTVQITSPTSMQILSDINIEWIEKCPLPNIIFYDNYRIQISTENVFYNIIKDINIKSQSNTLIEDLSYGQYYVRIRVEDNETTGLWSDITTFVFQEAKLEPILDNDTPIYIAPMEIISFPLSGETPSSILIELNTEIDPLTINDIIVIRRDV